MKKKQAPVLLCPQCSGELTEIKHRKKPELFCNNCGASIVKITRIRADEAPEVAKNPAQLRKKQ
jgi:rRNA maturation endonuclease Nob1